MTDDEQTTPPEAPSFDTRLVTPEPPGPPRWSSRFASPLTRLDALVLAGIVVVTAVVFFARLGAPDAEIPLDERHYVPDARDVLAFGTESDVRVPEDSGAFVVHPPVGKWFIAAGIKLFGDEPFGWRFFGAFVGVASVVLLYLLARRLWASAWFAALAALLLGVEGLWFVQSRIAMLDIYAAFFVLAGVWLVLEDRDRTTIEHRGPRPWRLAAGATIGFGIATKWSVLPFWIALIVLAVGVEVIRIRRRRAAANPDLEPSFARQMRRASAAIAGSLLLLPLVVYGATFTPWVIDEQRYDPPRCDEMTTNWFSDAGVPRALTGWLASTGRYGQWVCYQREMLDFHRNLAKFETEDEEQTVTLPDGSETTETVTVTKPAHPYFSEGWSWPWVGRPVAHYFESTGEGDTARRTEVLGAPNPVIWMPAFLIAVPALAWWTIAPRVRRWRRRRRGDAEPLEPERLDGVAPILLLLLAAGYGPVLLADIVDRPVFMFYATPMVPFLVLGVVHVLVRATRGGARAAWVSITYAGLAVLSFAYLYPVLAAWPLSQGGFFGWSGRILYGSQPWTLFGWELPVPPVDCLAENVIKKFCWI